MDLALAKDKSSSSSLSYEIAPSKVEEKSINRDSSSVLVFTKEELKERIAIEIEYALN